MTAYDIFEAFTWVVIGEESLRKLGYMGYTLKDIKAILLILICKPSIFEIDLFGKWNLQTGKEQQCSIMCKILSSSDVSRRNLGIRF